jgi:S1-C subfamily serine protease
MSGPKHLWSGDWRREAEAAAEQRAQRRAELDQTEEHRAAPSSASPRVTMRARALTWLHQMRSRLAGGLVTRRLRGSALRAVLALLGAVVAFAVVSSITGSRSFSHATPGWLGVDLASLSSVGQFSHPGGGPMAAPPRGGGAVIANVMPNSPAAAAGLEPGDVITQLDKHAVASPADVQSALAGMHAGDRVQIQYARGPSFDTTVATLVARPAGSP